MAKIPLLISNLVKDVPESAFEKVLVSLKITEKDIFKKYALNRTASKTLYGDFVLSLFSCEKATISALYNSIEGVLFIGGCAPGVGIAFNIIDACFCFILGNWLGCFVAIISCFPIPGFKIAGKGIEKFMMALLKRISPAELLSLINKLGKSLSRIGFHTDKSYMAIRKQIESIIPELHNPFAEAIIKELSKIIKRFPTTQRGISNSISKSGDDFLLQYSVQPKLLEVTKTISHL